MIVSWSKPRHLQLKDSYLTEIITLLNNYNEQKQFIEVKL